MKSIGGPKKGLENNYLAHWSSNFQRSKIGFETFLEKIGIYDNGEEEEGKTFSQVATLTPILKTPVLKRVVSKWDILKSPVSPCSEHHKLD